MYKLEHGMDDKKKARGQESTLNRLIATNNAQWKDDYALNCAMRRSFRVNYFLNSIINISVKTHLIKIRNLFFFFVP